MGKKMGMNSKAVAAKERKNEKAASEKAAKDAAIEDAKWADDNKQCDVPDMRPRVSDTCVQSLSLYVSL